MKIGSAPLIIKLILLAQFIGIVLLGLSTQTFSPLYLTITFGGGTGLVALAFLVWMVLLFRELWGFVRGLDQPGVHRR